MIPILLASPNNLLSPVVTFVVPSVYAGLNHVRDVMRFGRDRALLTLVSLAVKHHYLSDNLGAIEIQRTHGTQ
jgi:hypothetical protein